MHSDPAGRQDPQRGRLGAQEAVSPTWRMEIRDPGMHRSPRSLPLPGAESCTLGRVVSGDAALPPPAALLHVAS